MIVEGQEETSAFLLRAGVLGTGEPPDIIDTHISRIFLAGDRAYKIKRAVKLPYVDFSTPLQRLSACEKEVALNALTAPGLYLGVRRIIRAADGTLGFEGAGELVDAVIVMARFDQSALLDRMALSGCLTAAIIDDVADTIANFHRSAPPGPLDGGAANMSAVLDINEAGFATSSIFASDALESLAARFRSALGKNRALLDARAASGHVRRCHGDLHLRNICMLEGKPRLFDCIEFNDAIATVDVLYDLAFLLMDLWHRGFRAHANRLVNRYLDITADDGGYVLLPFFMAVRAAVRAHVTATQASSGGSGEAALREEAQSYFDLAAELLKEKPPFLIAIGGLSGTGKTTVAEALAPMVWAPPGARIIESDRIRKAMHGKAPEVRLPQEAYAPEVSRKVYAEMVSRTGVVLQCGGAVVADAVFDRAEDRAAMAGAAAEAAVRFGGIWLSTSADMLRARVGKRRGGPSDATVDVLERQLQRNPGAGNWLEFDASRPVAQTVADIRESVAADGR
jgi:aminoglycoside phosphotransferase family enzyme/predicted kinase